MLMFAGYTLGSTRLDILQGDNIKKDFFEKKKDFNERD